MCVYVRTKFQVSCIILTTFRWEVILPTPLHPAKWTPKNPTQVKVNLKLFPTDIIHVSNTVYLYISPSVDGQLTY